MVYLINEERVRQLQEHLGSVYGLPLLIDECCRKIGELYQIDRVSIALSLQGSEYRRSYSAKGYEEYFLPLHHERGKVYLDGIPVNTPLIVDRIDDDGAVDFKVKKIIQQAGILSVVVFHIRTETFSGFLELHAVSAPRTWQSGELSELRLGLLALDSALKGEARLTRLRSSYQRLLETGNTVIFRTDPDLSVNEVIGNSLRLFGISHDRFLKSSATLWARLIHKEDLGRVKQQIAKVMAVPSEFAEEFRIVHQSSGLIRRVLGRGVPSFSTTGELIGWEGIAVDITDVRLAEEEVISQQQRIEALYEVARALQMNLDPSMVALKGIVALIKATNSDSGLVFSFDEKSDYLELIAAHGVSQLYLKEAERLINGPSLVRHAINHHEGILVDDIQHDPRAVIKVAKLEGLRATIVTPLTIGPRVLGAVVVFRKENRRYTLADLDLVTAASHQIALAMRQADLYANEKKQADLFAALYRLSHELSRHLGPKEISHHAFKILHHELACKRMWLGVINEQGTHIVGQAGFGPGVRKRIVDLQIELNADQNTILNQAISRKEPLVIYPKETDQCTGLEKIFDRLSPSPFAVVPLVSLGQLVGILVIEPSVGAGFFTPARLSFLTSMANEIAVVLMANRFQSRLAESDKMRMAGLFASGVAHNFNNMLQAILGQASLMEMQLDRRSTLRDAVEIIKGAAGRGAGLVKQLLNFAASDSREKSTFAVPDLISQSKDLYKTILGSNIEFTVESDGEECLILADRGQIQQVITNLLINAKEAITGSGGQVSLSCHRIRLRSGEIDPELPPGDYVRVEIRDNGIGMEPDMVSRCFEPFFTTKNVDPVTGIGISGSGLGLSTAYSILKQHEGLITVQSVPAEGSIFSIYIPLAAAHQARATKVNGNHPKEVSKKQDPKLEQRIEVVRERGPLGFVKQGARSELVAKRKREIE